MEKFRRFLRESGYRILDEEMLREDGKFYQAIRAASAGNGECGKEARMDEKLCKLQDRYGPVLLQKKTPVFFEFLEREAALYEEILENLRKQEGMDERRRERVGQVEALLADNRRAQN